MNTRYINIYIYIYINRIKKKKIGKDDYFFL